MEKLSEAVFHELFSPWPPPHSGRFSQYTNYLALRCKYIFTIGMILQSPPVVVSFSKEVLVHMLELDPKVVETQVISHSIIQIIFEQISSIDFK